MGNINQSWRDTMALLGRHFTKEELAAGWPESFQIEHIARLQRPYKLGDLEAKRLLKSFFDGLKAACQSGELPNTKTTRIVKRQWSKTIPIRFESTSWDGVPGKTHTVSGVTDDEVVTYRVTAPVFKTWLAAQGEEPSVHIQAWFDAVGVADAVMPDAPVVVVNVAPQKPQAPAKQNKHRDLLVPLIETAQRETSDQFDAPAIWAKLCTMAGKQIRPLLGKDEDGLQWTDGEDELRHLTLKQLRDRLGRQKKATQKTAKTPLKRVK